MNLQGKIKKYVQEKGFGFIRCEQENMELFFHISEFQNGIDAPPIELESVRFNVKYSDRGIQAVNIYREADFDNDCLICIGELEFDINTVTSAQLEHRHFNEQGDYHAVNVNIQQPSLMKKLKGLFSHEEENNDTEAPVYLIIQFDNGECLEFDQYEFESRQFLEQSYLELNKKLLKKTTQIQMDESQPVLSE